MKIRDRNIVSASSFTLILDIQTLYIIFMIFFHRTLVGHLSTFLTSHININCSAHIPGWREVVV